MYMEKPKLNENATEAQKTFSLDPRKYIYKKKRGVNFVHDFLFLLCVEKSRAVCVLYNS